MFVPPTLFLESCTLFLESCTLFLFITFSLIPELIINSHMRYPFFITIFISACFLSSCNNDSNTPGSTEENKKNKKDIAVMAYYFPGGNLTRIDSFPVEKLSHIIFSFCHLKGNRLSVDNAKDTAAIQKLVSLKQRNAALKIILS